VIFPFFSVPLWFVSSLFLNDMSTMQNSELQTAAFMTLGCKVNQYETQVMRESLRKCGYRIGEWGETADVYVINTCTVTGVSDRKSRQMIRRAAALNPDAVVVVTGCYVERCADEIRNMPGVDLVLLNNEKHLIGEYLSSPLYQRGVRGDFERKANLGDHPESPFGKDSPTPALHHQRRRRVEDYGEIPPNPPLIRGETESSVSSIRSNSVPALPRQRGSGVENDGEIPPNPPLIRGEMESSVPLIRGETELSVPSIKGEMESSVSSIRGENCYPGITSFDGQTRALVKIEDGCDSFCTYCIVPYTRGGTIRSRPIDSIVQEVRSLAKNGHHEMVLTGIHLGAYGKMTDGTMLHHVLQAVHEVDGVQRIRLSSIEPMDISDDLINTMARLRKCAHHFHISLQSGSDRILRLMRRGYTSSDFRDVVDRIRAAMPDVGLSTDVMVGFPGETEEDFRDTCDLISGVRFSRLHVFRYSPRSGTPAAKFPDRVQNSVASRRSEEARMLGDSLAQEFRSQMLGKTAEVLVEESREGKDRLLAGFTSNYVRALITDAPDELAGEMVQVKLVDVEDEYMIGRLEPDQ